MVQSIYASFGSNTLFEMPKNNKKVIGDRLRDAAIAATFIAYGCFYYGITCASAAFNIHFSSFISSGL